MATAKRVRPPTIADVARLAEVSLPTVSRVLTGATPVTDATRARVVAAMAELKYRPNGAARALVQGRQPIVGIVVRDVTVYGESQVIKAVEEAARRTGYVIAIAVLDPADLSTTGKSVDLLLAQPIVGVVVLDFHHYDQTDLLSRMASVATVTLTGDAEAVSPHVIVDDRRAARELTSYLLSLGHKTVHHVGVHGLGDQQHPREAGWRDALAAAEVVPPQPVLTDWDIQEGRAAGLTLAGDPSVTAVMCANDELAFGVMRGLHEGGRIIPDDVSVTGIDDHPLAQMWVPALTTCRLDWHRAGVEAFELLLDSDRGTPSVTPIHMVLRDSAAPPPSTIA